MLSSSSTYFKLTEAGSGAYSTASSEPTDEEVEAWKAIVEAEAAPQPSVSDARPVEDAEFAVVGA